MTSPTCRPNRARIAAAARSWFPTTFGTFTNCCAAAAPWGYRARPVPATGRRSRTRGCKGPGSAWSWLGSVERGRNPAHVTPVAAWRGIFSHGRRGGAHTPRPRPGTVGGPSPRAVPAGARSLATPIMGRRGSDPKSLGSVAVTECASIHGADAGQMTRVKRVRSWADAGPVQCPDAGPSWLCAGPPGWRVRARSRRGTRWATRSRASVHGAAAGLVHGGLTRVRSRADAGPFTRLTPAVHGLDAGPFTGTDAGSFTELTRVRSRGLTRVRSRS